MDVLKKDVPAYKPKTAWLALLGGLGIYFVNAAAQNKIPPILLDLTEMMCLSLADAGWTMSVMSLAGLILALPAGGIIMKLGVRWTTVIAALFQLAGSLLCTVASDFIMLLISRALEGIALGLCNVVSFAVVTSFFPPEKRGIPNSLVTASFTLATFMMMNVAVPLQTGFGFAGLWWFVDILSVLAVAAAFFLIPSKDKEIDFGDNDKEAAKGEKVDFKKLLSTPAIWIVPIVFVVFNIGYYGISTYMPTYLVEGVGADQATANFATSLNSLVGLPSALIVGFLLNKVKIKNRKYIAALTMFGLAVCYFMSFGMPTVLSAAILLVFMGFICTFVPVSLYTIGPDIIPSAAYAAIILAIVTFGQNLGMTLGPLVVGYIVDAFGGNFTACSIPLALLAAVGGFIMLFVKVKGKTLQK